MSEEIKQEKVKQPASPEKKAKIKRIITLVSGGVALLILILFASFYFKPTAKVSFFSNGGTKIESIVIDRKTGKIEAPEKETQKLGYDFMGWYEKENLTGDPIDFSTHTFMENGKVVSTKLYAKWELHKYVVKLINVETQEEIKLLDEEGNELLDENGNPFVFYITARHEKSTEIEQLQYLAVNGKADQDPTKGDTISEADKLANADEFEIKYITNIHRLPNFDNLKFYKDLECTTLYETVSRKNIETKYTEIVIYVTGYPTAE